MLLHLVATQQVTFILRNAKYFTSKKKNVLNVTANMPKQSKVHVVICCLCNGIDTW